MMRFLRQFAAGLASLPWRRGTLALGLLLGSLCAVSWYATAPLEETDAGAVAVHRNRGAAPRRDTVPVPQPAAAGPDSSQAQPEMPEWPEKPLEGQAAKELLLRMMQAVDRSFHKIACYTLTFHKQVRIQSKLLPEQKYFIKVRQDPFAIYMKSIEPVAGRELIYAEGHYDNHVIGHPVGMARLLVPRLKVPPDHPLILAESRHPLNQAGLGNLIRKLVGYREQDLKEPEAVTILDRTDTPDGRRWLRSRHIHPRYRPGRPLAEAEVLYDPDSRLPLRFTGLDWPADGKSEKLLGERDCYDELDTRATLSAADFDPANPAYEFHRF